MATQPQELTVVRQQPSALTEAAQLDVDGLRAIQYGAKIMAKSGCFADIKGIDEEVAIAKAVVKIAIGRDFGFSMAESMQYVELIQGRPSISAHARAAKMKAAGYSWKFLQFDANICVLDVFDRKGERLGDSSFTLEDAKRMALADKDNWKKNPRNMLYCRAISNAQRWYAPEVLSAALGSTEELVDDEAYQRATPIQATVSIDSVRASTDANRGHEDTNVQDGHQRQSQQAAEIKRFAPKNGIAVFSDLLPFDQVTDAQRIYVRTQAGDELFQFDASGPRWVPLPDGG